MVVLLDLEDEVSDPNATLKDDRAFPPARKPFWATNTKLNILTTSQGSSQSERPLLNCNGFSAALACYPIVTQLARSLDLNSLHALSRTCHRFRASLMQFRGQLMSRTLRCSTELARSERCTDISRTYGYSSWEVSGDFGVSPLRIASGKSGPCARDMVGDCRRCGRIVCRNCIMKSPPVAKFKNRHRRLCSICIKAPLPDLMSSLLQPSITPDASSTGFSFHRDHCTCLQTLFICQPCGHAIFSADISYRRIWEWRTRYSTYLGGLGTGIGEGNEGVKCGRGFNCLAAEDIEVETDCKAEELSTLYWMTIETEGGEDGAQFEAYNETGEKAGYLRQEIEGIGGVVRTKVKRRVRVGKTVEEHEDERERAEYLAREARGESRSWCGWCNRVIPARGEVEECT